MKRRTIVAIVFLVVVLAFGTASVVLAVDTEPIAVPPIPEPSTLLMALIGMGALVLARKRRAGD
jgi:hypothetical protein